MRRPIALGLGLLVTIAPERIVEPAERLAFENPDAGRLRPWTLPIARLKGLLFVRLLGRRSENPRVLPAAVAGLGALLALAPRSALAVGLRIAYENSDDLEVKPWVVPAARVLGVCYLAVGLFAGRATAPDDREESASIAR
ncbi:hypothetical protein [Haloterrigena alkaliphila]|uniref:DUF4267 domain-containing protein n=1 Tax=Haloterrigena alkaliphila TaxID=2816475 RepID=A0A8A2VEX7_9EURY|nr:hypothetical protein [Haloterrigena alkaliphila]QSX00610.1 hypothetical protein J0X25_06535 [Haloterrigena alkaliphila]